jgi:hypothetical protein
VPESFPQSVGAATGLVGAAGGLGGFFPPLVLGAVRQATGAFTAGFVLLGLFAIICFVVVSSRRLESYAIRIDEEVILHRRNSRRVADCSENGSLLFPRIDRPGQCHSPSSTFSSMQWASRSARRSSTSSIKNFTHSGSILD